VQSPRVTDSNNSLTFRTDTKVKIMDLSYRVIGCALEVHRHLGPGLLESIYETCLCRELDRAGLAYVRQQRLPVIYKGEDAGGDLRMDVVIEQALVLEIQAVAQLHPIHEAQLITYLRLSGIGLGLLINFNEAYLRKGNKRRRV